MAKVSKKGKDVEEEAAVGLVVAERSDFELARDREAEVALNVAFDASAALGAIPQEKTIGESIANDVRCVMRLLDTLRDARARGATTHAIDGIRGAAALCFRMTFVRLQLALVVGLPLDGGRRAAGGGWTINNSVPIWAAQGEVIAQIDDLERDVAAVLNDPWRWADHRARDFFSAYMVVSHQARNLADVVRERARGLDGDQIPRQHGFQAAAWEAVLAASLLASRAPPHRREQAREGVAACAFLTAAYRVGPANEEASRVDAFAVFMADVRGSELLPEPVTRAALRALGWNPGGFSSSHRKKRNKGTE